MQTRDALALLGLSMASSDSEIESAIKQKQAELDRQLELATSDESLAALSEAQSHLDLAKAQLLGATSTAQPGSVAKMSATKLADLPRADHEATNQSLLSSGQLLAGRYEVQEQIGSGGMGAVYRARDRNTGEPVALKVMLPTLMRDPRARERFLDEARLSQKLSHPNIVNVYDVQQDGELYFLTMELLEGQDLRQVMENRRLARQVFSSNELLDLAEQLCEALSYAHRYTVHRDLKPENIWLCDDGTYKLMDFGIARLMGGSQRTHTSASMGTAYYMAPEQLSGQKNVDGRADLYALAVLLYETASGDVPAGIIKPLKDKCPALPKAFAKAVMQGLESDPDDRFPDAQAFLAALKRKGSSLPSLSLPRLPSLPSLSSLPWRSAAIAVVTAMLIVGSSYLVTSDGFTELWETLTVDVDQREAEERALAIQNDIQLIRDELASLSQQLSDDVQAAQAADSDDYPALLGWLELTNTAIFESERMSALEAAHAEAQQLLKESRPEEAYTILEGVLKAYVRFQGLFVAAQELALSKRSVESLHERWQERISQWEVEAAEQVTLAEEAMRNAKLAVQEADFEAASQAWHDAETYWQQAFALTDSQIEEIEAQRLAQAAEARRQAQLEAEAQARAKAEAARFKALLGEMVTVPGGRFRRGSTAIDPKVTHEAVLIGLGDTLTRHKPVVEVTISGFQLGMHEVTQALWREIMGTEPSYFNGCDTCPVERVTWDQVHEFILKLNKRTGRNFRLPTEAEWEYACRSGGKNQKFCGGDDLDKLAWHGDNSGGKTHPVGQKEPNGLGIYDMTGNVAEWVQDCWHDNYQGAPSDGSAWISGCTDKFGGRIIRGSFYERPGSYQNAMYLGSSFRQWSNNSGFAGIGFRLAHDLPN